MGVTDGVPVATLVATGTADEVPAAAVADASVAAGENANKNWALSAVVFAVKTGAAPPVAVGTPPVATPPTRVSLELAAFRLPPVVRRGGSDPRSLTPPAGVDG